MIIKAEIINQPTSGEHEEIIFDIDSVWNSSHWTWVKFTDSEQNVIIGEFRGSEKAVCLSEKRNEIIVLTSDWIYRINSKDLKLIESESSTRYQDLVISPNGNFIFHDFYNIERLDSSLFEKTLLKSPFEMDDISFKSWNGDILEFECEEFSNWSRKELMELDTVNWIIKIKTPHNTGS